ncbi:hypothetical protein BJ979_001862 [Schumannella luteola]|uniref:Uncharacterized protein n=1 Tax=Schumannella luteola TaxID=472059 RepID=A0A852Y8F5_9MICO|nr:hypothetical protein [Schumannella luteola]NYG99236.1 hypothetical protein [Schumannella luteola]
MTRAQRVYTVVSDFVPIVGALVMLVAFTSTLASTWGSAVVAVVVGVVTVGLAGWAAPALIVLWMSPPPRPLVQRSALVARAAWFGRTVFAVSVFGFSIIAGSVAGVIASKVADAASPEHAIDAAWGAITGIALPALGAVFGALYVYVGVRWLMDLGTLLAEERAKRVIDRLILRWAGDTEPSRRRHGIVTFAELAVDGGRLPLGLLMVLVLVDVSAAVVDLRAG